MLLLLAVAMINSGNKITVRADAVFIHILQFTMHYIISAQAESEV